MKLITLSTAKLLSEIEFDYKGQFFYTKDGLQTEPPFIDMLRKDVKDNLIPAPLMYDLKDYFETLGYHLKVEWSLVEDKVEYFPVITIIGQLDFDYEQLILNDLTYHNSSLEALEEGLIFIIKLIKNG